MSRLSWLTLAGLTVLTAGATQAAWRGNETGVFPDAQPPLTWSETNHVAWRTELPAWGNGSPCVTTSRVYVTYEPHGLACLDRADGRLLWRAESPGEDTLTEAQRAAWAAAAPERERQATAERDLKTVRDRLKKNATDPDLAARRTALEAEIKALKERLKDVPVAPRAGGHADTGGSTATPVIDPATGHIFTFYGSGVVAAHDAAGRRLWIRALPLGGSAWGHCASPLLLGDRLIVSHGPVTALELADGRTVWQVPAETRYGTPVVRNRAANQIVTPGGLLLDAAAGRVLSAGLPKLPYNAPVVAAGAIYLMGVGDTEARRYDVNGDGLATQVWSAAVEKGRYYASPLAADGLVFGVRQSGLIVALDAATGAPRGARACDALAKGATCYPSPALAGGRLYVGSDNGVTLVLSPTPDLAVLATNRLEKTRACPVFDGRELFVRGMRHLYCIRD